MASRAPRKVHFRQADVLRAVKAVKAGGVDIGSVEIDPESGKIVVIAAKEIAAPANDLDKWLARHAS